MTAIDRKLAANSAAILKFAPFPGCRLPKRLHQLLIQRGKLRQQAFASTIQCGDSAIRRK